LCYKILIKELNEILKKKHKNIKNFITQFQE